LPLDLYALARALAQPKNDIRFCPLDHLDKLPAIKPHWEYDFAQAPASGH
jgi:hypothetical protein